MHKNPYAKEYWELIVYKKSTKLTNEIFSITKDFPADERYSLTSQIRRSSRSIGAQLAEAWAKRFYKKHFISKLADADAELNETEHWIITAYSCGYIPREKKEKLIQNCHEIGRL